MEEDKHQDQYLEIDFQKGSKETQEKIVQHYKLKFLKSDTCKKRPRDSSAYNDLKFSGAKKSSLEETKLAALYQIVIKRGGFLNVTSQ